MVNENNIFVPEIEIENFNTRNLSCVVTKMQKLQFELKLHCFNDSENESIEYETLY